MSLENIITILAGVIQTGAITFFVYLIIKGLKQNVINLKQTIDIQNKTIETMDKRILETEKISDIYKKFIDDYPKVLETYKATIVKTKDDIIMDLTQRVEGQKEEINDLNDQIKILNINEQKLFHKITSYLFSGDCNTYINFFKYINENITNIILTIIKSKNFEDFIKINNYNIFIDDNFVDMFAPSKNNSNREKLEVLSFNNNGLLYAFTIDKELYVNNEGKILLDEFYNGLKK